MVIPSGDGKGQFDPENDIPVLPIVIKPGEVLYLGTLYVDGIRHNAVVEGKSPSIVYKVMDEKDAILEKLNKEYPQYSSQLQTRLFELVE